MKFFKLIYVLITALSTLSCYSQTDQPKIKSLNVGDIVFDAKTDRSDFFLCDSSKIYQYYNFGTKYIGEKKELRSVLFSLFKLNGKYKDVNGIITIRFVINCKGETDRFRIFQIDKNYQTTSFSKELIAHLLAITKKLNNWKPGLKEGKAIDSYAHINYIFENGILKDITP